MSDKKPEIRVKNTPMVKLKDKQNRNYVMFNLKSQFGFIPEVLIIEKIPRQNNVIIVRAVLTEEEMKKEDKMKSEMIQKTPALASK